MKGYSFKSLTNLVLKIFGTKINAGTGLSGGGSLEADRTLSVSYGTAAGTAAQGNDSRIVNAASTSYVDSKDSAMDTKKADKSITISAGTGLSGGGTLAANRSLAVAYGTAEGTAAQGNDSRLSNSREWTGATISQAEAEAGTATTRRAWTAQRVAQAISALGLKIGTTASTAKAGNWMPTWANVTGKPATFAPSAHTHSLSQITDAGSVASLNTNASTANFLRGDGSWVTPPNTNTTYSEISTAEIDAGTASTSRTISGRRMKYALDKKSDTGHTHPWAQVTGQPATATRWPAFTEVTGRPANYPTTWASVAAKPAQATRWPAWSEVTSKPAVVETSRTITAGTGLSGGGNLSANRTLSIATSHTPIGVGQTWQDVTGSRATGITYTNTSGRPIVVSFFTTIGGAGRESEIIVDGFAILVINIGGNVTNRAGASAIIPASSTYSVKATNIGKWMELR